MAKKMALVPESWLSARLSSEGKKTDPQPQIVIADVADEPQNKLMELSNLLPKRLQNKARMLLHYLNGHVKLNEQQRIVYSNGSVGSHIIDLVRYNISPFVKGRPIDAPLFDRLMKSAGVPDAALIKREKNHSDIINDWVELD